MSFNSNTTGITSGAGTFHPSGVTELTTGLRVLNLSFFCVEYCRSLFVVLSFCLLVFVMSAVLRFTASYFRFGIFKLPLYQNLEVDSKLELRV